MSKINFFPGMTAFELKEKLEDYLKKATPLFDGLEVGQVEGISSEVVEHFEKMTLGYFRDAKHFYEKKEYINSFGALEYAEGWLDAGKAVGIFK
ncbi:MAG: DUF357 domain-containing protein [Candidatus Altiarchaeota archaeon]